MNGSSEALADLLFLDVETTGLLFHPESRIVEISLSHWTHTGHQSRYTSLINPLEHIPDLYTKIHGINDAMVKDAPTFREFWEDNQSRLKDKTIVAHNLAFDMGMINKELLRLEIPPIGNAGIDTVPVLKKLLPNEINHKLQNLAVSLGVVHKEKHRAEHDVMALEHILTIAMNEPINILTGPLGIDLALRGGIASHRYFRDMFFWAQKEESGLDIILARKGPEQLSLERIYIEKPSCTAKRFGEYRDRGRYPLAWSEVYRIESR